MVLDKLGSIPRMLATGRVDVGADRAVRGVIPLIGEHHGVIVVARGRSGPRERQCPGILDVAARACRGTSDGEVLRSWEADIELGNVVGIRAVLSLIALLRITHGGEVVKRVGGLRPLDGL